MTKRQIDLPTMAALARAAHPVLTTLAGLDEVSMRYVARHTVTRGFAQAHYTNLQYERFFGSCYEAWDQFEQYLLEYTHRPDWWPDPEETQPNSQPPHGGIGSPAVRITAATHDTVLRLESIIRRSARPRNHEDVLTHHIAYTAYFMIAYDHLGIRPHNSLHLRGANQHAVPAYWPISDKQSKEYWEERLLYVPQVIVHLRRQLGTGRRRLTRELLSHIGSTAAARLPQELVFFLGGDGKVIPFSRKAFRSVLKQLDVGFPVDTPPNYGRHWLRTRLHEDGVHDDLINLWLGHTAGGREPLARHASTSYGPALTELRNRIAEYLAELGFRPLEYFRD